MHVAQWLQWAIREFNLENIPVENFTMRGHDLLSLGRESFLLFAPPFAGDILWEHLDILQKGTTLLSMTPFQLQGYTTHC
jgi:c-ets proto-oncogene protein